jgi:hypothetical protein
MAQAYAVARLILGVLRQLPLHHASHGPPPHLAMGRQKLVATPLPPLTASAKKALAIGGTDTWRLKHQCASLRSARSCLEGS